MGENLNPREVSYSIARRLGIDTAGLIPDGRDVEKVVEMISESYVIFKLCSNG